MNPINSHYPLIQFSGKITLVSSEESEEKALARLSSESLVGFDTETRPSFKKGEFYHVALIQLSTFHQAFLFRINKYGLTPAMAGFLGNKSVAKVGVGIRDDFSALRKIKEFQPASFVDLSLQAQGLGILKTGVRNLTNLLLAARISKSQQTSNWERKELTEKQMVYAATDAWICLELYQKLAQYTPA